MGVISENHNLLTVSDLQALASQGGCTNIIVPSDFDGCCDASGNTKVVTYGDFEDNVYVDTSSTMSSGFAYTRQFTPPSLNGCCEASGKQYALCKMDIEYVVNEPTKIELKRTIDTSVACNPTVSLSSITTYTTSEYYYNGDTIASGSSTTSATTEISDYSGSVRTTESDGLFTKRFYAPPYTATTSDCSGKVISGTVRSDMRQIYQYGLDFGEYVVDCSGGEITGTVIFGKCGEIVSGVVISGYAVNGVKVNTSYITPQGGVYTLTSLADEDTITIECMPFVSEDVDTIYAEVKINNGESSVKEIYLGRTEEECGGRDATYPCTPYWSNVVTRSGADIIEAGNTIV